MANTSKRGFASMDRAKQREIASKGGKAAHAKGTAHEFTSDEARVAGRKGGEAVSRDRAHMSAIGREGGHSRGARARAGQTGSSTGSRAASTSTPSYNRPTVSEQRAGVESGSRSGSIGTSNAGEERGTDRAFAASEGRPYSGRDEI